MIDKESRILSNNDKYVMWKPSCKHGRSICKYEGDNVFKIIPNMSELGDPTYDMWFVVGEYHNNVGYVGIVTNADSYHVINAIADRDDKDHMPDTIMTNDRQDVLEEDKPHIREIIEQYCDMLIGENNG